MSDAMAIGRTRSGKTASISLPVRYAIMMSEF